MDNSISVDLMQLSSAERRKVLKPRVERKRRDRINKSLNDLKEILIQNDPRLRSRASKLEKADILDLVVEQMNINRYGGEIRSPSSGSYTEGYLDCLNGTLTYLWQTGVISNPQMCNLIRDTLLQQLMQKTGQNPMTRSTHGVTTPGIVQVTSEPFASDLGTFGISEVPHIAFGKPSISQLPHASGLSIFDASQIPTMSFDRRAHVPDIIYEHGTPAGLSKVPFDNKVPMPCADSQFSTAASLSLSESLPKSRFVPYTTKSRRPALRNKNANSSGLAEALPITRNETVESDTARVWSVNDDVCYSMTSFPWMSSDESNQPPAKESSSMSQEGKKLQKKTRCSESMTMSRSNASLRQRPLSVKISAKVVQQKLPESSSRLEANSKSTTCINETRRLLAMESSTAVKEGGSQAMPSDQEPSSGTMQHPTKDDSTGATSEKSNQDDVWRPF